MDMLTIGEAEQVLNGETPRAVDLLRDFDIPEEIIDPTIKEQIRGIIDLLVEGGDFFEDVVAMHEENQLKRLEKTMVNMERKMFKYEGQFKRLAEKNKRLLDLRKKLKSYV